MPVDTAEAQKAQNQVIFLMGKYELAQVSGFRDQGTEIRNRKIHT